MAAASNRQSHSSLASPRLTQVDSWTPSICTASWKSRPRFYHWTNSFDFEFAAMASDGLSSPTYCSCVGRFFIFPESATGSIATVKFARNPSWDCSTVFFDPRYHFLLPFHSFLTLLTSCAAVVAQMHHRFD